MRESITALRAQMKAHCIDWYIVPSTDFHGTEYVNAHFRCRQFLSGFTGSAGTLLVGLQEALLWTDGRYFLQAGRQLAGSGITLMKAGEPGVPTLLEFLENKRKSGRFVLGFDGRVISRADGLRYEALDVDIRWDQDLTDAVWSDRPPVVPAAVYELPLSVTGRTRADKIGAVRAEMKRKGADRLLLTSLEEIAWLLNLRGSDIANNPVFFAFALLDAESDGAVGESDAEPPEESTDKASAEESANKAAADEPTSDAEAPAGSASNAGRPATAGGVQLFVYDGVLPAGFHDAHIRSYEAISSTLAQIPQGTTLWMNGKQANYALFRSLHRNIKILDAPSPIDLMKAIKNNTEIDCERAAHRKDGLAMVRFLYWLKSTVGNKPLTEIDAADRLEALRREQGARDLSFPTIAGYNENGAVIHYAPTPETDATLSPSGFLLVDSGGQYPDGTTDITRTIPLGPLTTKMKRCYTAVLQAHIALASARFAPGTTGRTLDEITRRPIRALGLDYNHGTGHGVGHLLSCHEGPNIISKRGSSQAILPGMITSDEPGVYLEGEFGVRLENLLLCEDMGDGTFGFTPLTLCPFDRAAILPEMLTTGERTWLNRYHATVYKVLSPHLPPALADWLAVETAEI